MSDVSTLNHNLFLSAGQSLLVFSWLSPYLLPPVPEPTRESFCCLPQAVNSCLSPPFPLFPALKASSTLTVLGNPCSRPLLDINRGCHPLSLHCWSFSQPLSHLFFYGTIISIRMILSVSSDHMDYVSPQGCLENLGKLSTLISQVCSICMKLFLDFFVEGGFSPSLMSWMDVVSLA